MPIAKIASERPCYRASCESGLTLVFAQYTHPMCINLSSVYTISKQYIIRRQYYLQIKYYTEIVLSNIVSSALSVIFLTFGVSYSLKHISHGILFYGTHREGINFCMSMPNSDSSNHFFIYRELRSKGKVSCFKKLVLVAVQSSSKNLKIA